MQGESDQSSCSLTILLAPLSVGSSFCWLLFLLAPAWLLVCRAISDAGVLKSVSFDRPPNQNRESGVSGRQSVALARARSSKMMRVREMLQKKRPAFFFQGTSLGFIATGGCQLRLVLLSELI